MLVDAPHDNTRLGTRPGAVVSSRVMKDSGYMTDMVEEV